MHGLDHYAANLYYDTLLHDTAALEFLIRRAGAEHVALGSDYPFPLSDDHPASSVNKVSSLTSEEKREICWNTGARLLGLPVSPL